MKHVFSSLFASALVLSIVLFSSCGPDPDPGGDSVESIPLAGLEDKVEIVIDHWGISHIYASSEKDLFFAQGFNAARDRLFQFEVWRRQATGTVAELLGPGELNRDIGTRLFKYRGDMQEEMNHYHPRGVDIITSYVRGVNAFIQLTRDDPGLLPPEFEILGTQPEFWTPEVVISRHQGLLGNIGQELSLGRAVAALGVDEVKRLTSFQPSEPNLELDPSISLEMLEKDILGVYNAFRRPVRFTGATGLTEARNVLNDLHSPSPLDPSYDPDLGSNNWIVAGFKTESGFPIMANDPHRSQATPSLRYWAHLVGPGWNVIGGGEPEIPGISIGHNGVGAWGLTVFRTDGEDLMVYDLNPDNMTQYMYKGSWMDMQIITETIPVRGAEDEEVELHYTIHGPVTFIDSVLHKGYAVRCAWLEPGGSPYLASLRMDQAQSWEEFREACDYSNIPGENMIWADKEGNIGWQAVGIAPVRKNWSGLIPVPGDGRFEWDRYLPIIQKPNITNPEAGYFASANEYLVPDDYEHWDAIGFSWSDPFRGNRARSILAADTSISMEDMTDLQTDYFSTPSSILVPMLLESGLEALGGQAQEARKILEEWDFVLRAESIAAGIYIAWEKELREAIHALFIPENSRNYIRSISMSKRIEVLEKPEILFPKAEDPQSQRRQLMRDSFEQALSRLGSELGPTTEDWTYGQEKYKHITLTHALDPLLSPQQKALFNVGPAPRGGSSFTINNTSSNNNQSSGASFRIIVDTGDFDKTLGTNNPGQSGNPDDPHYKDLFESWANDEYFPVYYSRELIEENTDRKIWLLPSKD